MPPSHCREFCLRTNKNWHSLHIAQHRIDSNYFVLVRCHFRISPQANTNVLKCSKHSYWPCESKPIRIASYCIAKRRINSCQFLLVRISSLYICIDSLYIRTGIRRLSAATQYVENNAQRSHCRIGSHMFALVRVSSDQFLSCSHHIIAQSYWFSTTTVLLRIASCRHRVASYCISLHRINSCLIRIDSQIIIVSNRSGSA